MRGMVADGDGTGGIVSDDNVLPINALRTLHAGDGRKTRAYLQDVFFDAAKGSPLPLPEYIFGLQHLIEVFYHRARADKQQFIPWLYVDEVLEGIVDSLRQGQVVRPLGFADTVVFEQSWDPAQRPRMAVFKPIVESIYGAAHAIHEHRTGPVSAYSQLHERMDDYLAVASAVAVALRERGDAVPPAASQGILLITDAKDLFYGPSGS